MMTDQDDVEQASPRLKAAFLEIVENQLRDNQPPETRETVKRLTSDGISEEDARIFIAQAIAVEVWDTLRNKNTYDRDRFIRNLKQLPKEPTA